MNPSPAGALVLGLVALSIVEQGALDAVFLSEFPGTRPAISSSTHYGTRIPASRLAVSLWSCAGPLTTPGPRASTLLRFLRRMSVSPSASWEVLADS